MLQETKPLILVARLGFSLNPGRKSAAAATTPAATTSTTGVVDDGAVDAGAVTDLVEQKKALKAEVGAHNKTKNELPQKTARTARLEDELRQIKQHAAQRTPQKRDLSPDRRRSGDHHNFSFARRY